MVLRHGAQPGAVDMVGGLGAQLWHMNMGALPWYLDMVHGRGARP